jgi:hypothetical protein
MRKILAEKSTNDDIIFAFFLDSVYKIIDFPFVSIRINREGDE